MNLAFLLLGSNLGDREKNLRMARDEIGSMASVTKLSSVYTTAPWGKTNQPDFLNQVLIAETQASPHELLDQLLDIEMRLGRKRKEKWGSRTIDIDILFFSDLIVSSDRLTILHPGIGYKRFTLLPLQEIAPDFVHPVLKRKISDLLDACEDMAKVEWFSGE